MFEFFDENGNPLTDYIDIRLALRQSLDNAKLTGVFPKWNGLQIAAWSPWPDSDNSPIYLKTTLTHLKKVKP